MTSKEAAVSPLKRTHCVRVSRLTKGGKEERKEGREKEADIFEAQNGRKDEE